ncbi:type II secretion system protein GspC [Pectobacterium aquaticum]|uniref:Type II secretion system protein GspC n=1 Tax=Pectobacterium aquaticum TaxID=2204145 RepID=A0AA93AP29_9GAMM|nr:type II secretion system protein GspC [Pectobacterium aquaticum]PLY35639.1 type II secretion system protein GspC [Pectobacterium carotovorum]MCH5051046.1 type II secretion system protein GspC [Pectobacterium aquaticum]RRN95748.1 type II secretion system protein GspC [Pectobacterium aquaticum]RRN99568.1 type II secretion system protein GspC [Pectobacterium aquaticum]RRO06377.1 type II secretion system protein GspC [Pectobacterium aquaticum]
MARLQVFKDSSFNSLVATFRSLPAPLIRRIVLGLILLLICQQLAVLTWRVLLPEDSRFAGVSVAPAQAKEKPTTLGDFTLFGHAPDADASVVNDAALSGDIPLTSLNISLTGVLASGDAKRSIAIIAKDSQQYSRNVGDAIPGYEAKIVTISADRVVLQYQGRYEALHLYQEDLSQERKATDTPSSSGAFNQVKDEIQKDPFSAQDYLTISPVTEEEVLKGYQLNPGKNPDLFYRAGLQDNDLAVSLNGMDLRDADQAQQAMAQLAGMSKFNLTVVRDGQQQDIYLALDGDH